MASTEEQRKAFSARLEALMNAQRLTDAELAPPKTVSRETATAEFISPTRVRLKVDQEMPFDVASKVLGILEGLKK